MAFATEFNVFSDPRLRVSQANNRLRKFFFDPPMQIIVYRTEPHNNVYRVENYPDKNVPIYFERTLKKMSDTEASEIYPKSRPSN